MIMICALGSIHQFLKNLQPNLRLQIFLVFLYKITRRQKNAKRHHNGAGVKLVTF